MGFESHVPHRRASDENVEQEIPTMLPAVSYATLAANRDTVKVKPNLIGLAGPAGVGKDTVAEMLERHDYWRYAFAGPLKQALAVLGLEEPSTREAKEALLEGRGFSYREAAQKLGTEWARELDNDFWLKLAAVKIKYSPYTVISDVRFSNEAEWVRSRGGVIWHIHGRATTVTGASARHASENPVKFSLNRDELVRNDGNLDDLQSIVDRLIGV